MTAEAATRFRPNPDVVGRVFDGAEILVHLGSNLMFELNPTASRVFRLLSDGHDVDAIVARLAVEFEADDGETAAGEHRGEWRAELAEADHRDARQRC